MFVLEIQSDFVHPIKYIKMYSINDKTKFYVYFYFFFIIEIDPFISLFFLQTYRLCRVKCFSFI